MKNLSLCIDIDGTITEAYDWLPEINQFFSTNIIAEDVVEYDIYKALGISEKEFNAFYIANIDYLCSRARIRNGVKDIIQKLYQDHQIHFVTAREVGLRSTTDRWLKKHNIPYHSLTTLGSHYKVDRAYELNCDIFIEDRYENAIELSLEGYDVLLIDCSYNRGPLNSKITRVSNWQQIAEFINKYSQKAA